MKLVVGFKYSVCTGTICHDMFFRGIAKRSYPFENDLFVFENQDEPGLYKFVGARIESHVMNPSDKTVDVVHNFVATHYGNSIAKLHKGSCAHEDWKLV